MAKLIGVALILSSLLAVVAGTYIDAKYGTATQVTGNVVFNILTQPEVKLGFFDYFEGIIFSYSIISFIMGILFLVRV